MKKIIISILGLSMFGLASADEKKVDLKSSATMEATCSISANQIGFGTVAAPLLAQTAQSEMTVKCSNASAYTIDLAYGGIYGQETKNVDYAVTYVRTNSNSGIYIVGNKDGVLGEVYCVDSGWVVFNTLNIAKAYGYQASTEASSFLDNKNVCNGRKINSNTLSIMGTNYSYGVMQGSFKGDSLAYSIAVPGDSTKVWNTGNNSYKSSGNGEFQIIPIVAKIVPDKSGSKYPAPDMYLDTITAVIIY